MDSQMFSGPIRSMEVVGPKKKAHLPGMTPALKQGSEGHTTSDLEFMMENERKQHEDSYKYANGHNDHGMGQ